MYCVKCGVELADGEKKCPLCFTPVYLPEGEDKHERLYPEYDYKVERVNPRGIYFIISFAFLIAAFISLVSDININQKLEWSDYVIGGLILGYISFILPAWFIRPNPAIFLPCDFLAAAVYVWYISFKTGGEWYFSFALPLIAFVSLAILTIVILSYYLRRGYLYVWGGTLIAAGLFSILLERLANITFGLPDLTVWGLYPAIALSLIGLMLIIIAVVKPFRESLCRIFSI